MPAVTNVDPITIGRIKKVDLLKVSLAKRYSDQRAKNNSDEEKTFLEQQHVAGSRQQQYEYEYEYEYCRIRDACDKSVGRINKNISDMLPSV
mmetsp:Transcript_22521/g.48961  ORF Transcript_22521/g.48961 Transcript_22521/m.48961 type:complete len:92 (-) Transcript_22521:782-1057(-)